LGHFYEIIKMTKTNDFSFDDNLELIEFNDFNEPKMKKSRKQKFDRRKLDEKLDDLFLFKDIEYLNDDFNDRYNLE
jgi:hypothetical protein